MAGEERAAVDDDDLPVREHFLQSGARYLIEFRAGAWHENSAVDYQEIGLGCRERVVVQEHLLRLRERNEPVRLSVKSPEGLKLRFHIH